MPNLEKCQSCGAACCKGYAVVIDTPEGEDEWLHLKWYLYHKGTTIFLDREGEWNVEVQLPCVHLGKDNKCMIYDRRPEVCAEYSEDSCEEENILEFTKPEEVDAYIEKLRKEGKL